MGVEPEDFPITTRHSRGLFSGKERIDSRNHRAEFIRWLIYLGNDPEMAEGYSRDTVTNTAYRTDQFCCWAREQEGG